eukprot:356557-Chlamydomonas_euryale.AAC.2
MRQHTSRGIDPFLALAPPLPGSVTSTRHLSNRAACLTLRACTKGQLASWGAGEFGQLGHGSEELSHPLPRFVRGLPPAAPSDGCAAAAAASAASGAAAAPPPSPGSVRLSRASAGASHSLVLSSSGGVYACGQGLFGAVGSGCDANAVSMLPLPRLWPVGVCIVACGDNHSAALTLDGRLFVWGRGKYGQLGLGDFQNR